MAMTKNQIWWLVSGGVGVVVAGAAYYAIKAGQCSGSECQIAVTVTDCAGGVIDASPDHAKITVAKNIKWTIKTPGYVFTPTGIQITGTDFKDNPGRIGQGDMWIIHDDNINNPGDNKYTIEVQPSAGAACTKKDPYIFNE
jgi:hypothetical protein